MQNDSALLRQFFDPAAVTSLRDFAINLLLSGVFAWVLGQVYIRFGHALSNRRLFARNFLPLAMTTTLIISIVKSSLALSLGLVGALSIVRFRAAIKEPEELAFLFLSISLGLGLGAGQPLVTLVAVVVIGGALAIRKSISTGPAPLANLFLSITTPNRSLALAQIQGLLQECGAASALRRLDESADSFEVSFQVSFPDSARLEEFSHRLRQLDAHARVSFLEDRGLGV